MQFRSRNAIRPRLDATERRWDTVQMRYDRPLIRGEPDMVGLLLGSRELLCLSSRISRTLVICSSLSELYLPVDIASPDGGGFQRGSARHVVAT